MELDDARGDTRPAELVRVMSDSMTHRGPDSAGIWVSGRGDVAFGHRRLAIVDLSAAGHQPMTSADGRWTLTYNGELYNAPTLRERLGGVSRKLRGHSDTEILVEMIATVGVEESLARIIGMFAFAAFDSERDELWLATDRFGEKPMYYHGNARRFSFASELGALVPALADRPAIDLDSLAELLERSAIRAPFTIYENVRRLQPGSWARVERGGIVHLGRYYDPTAVAISTPTVERSDADAVAEYEELLRQIVEERMVSDVPLGAFLSGGTDSSMVVAMMQIIGTRPAQTFTMGFEDPRLDESEAATAIARALGSDHHTWMVTGRDALSVVPELGSIYDEPFADPSQIPTILVSRFARQSVTVALSGDGGDELFGGYERYQLLARADRYRRLPSPLRRGAAWALSLLSEEAIDRLSQGPINNVLPGPFRTRTGKRAHSAAAMLQSKDTAQLYDLLTRPHRNGPGLVPGSRRRPVAPPDRLVEALGPIELGMALDTVDYLPNDILTKVDRASMSTSLEVRAPMLDPRLHQFAWSLRPDQRVRRGTGKWVVREALRRHVPEVADLPKRGFGVPLDEWLRGPLREWGEAMLSPSTLRERGLFGVERVRDLWESHLDSRRQLGVELWPILMFQAWEHANR